MESGLETITGPVHPESAGHGLTGGDLGGDKFVANGVIPAQEHDQVVLAFVRDGDADVFALVSVA